MKPTEMYFLSERKRASWRSRLSRLPLPKGLVMEAWNASVGYSADRCFSQRLVTQAGTYGKMAAPNLSFYKTCPMNQQCTHIKGFCKPVFCLNAGTPHQVAFVEQEQHVLVARVLFQVLLQVGAARSQRVSRIQHLHRDHTMAQVHALDAWMSRAHQVAQTKPFYDRKRLLLHWENPLITTGNGGSATWDTWHLARAAEGITYLDDDVGGVNHLVELAPNTLRLPLVIQPLSWAAPHALCQALLIATRLLHIIPATKEVHHHAPS